METENGIFKRTQNKLITELAFLKWRMLGMVIIVVMLIVGLVISFLREDNLVIIDKNGDIYNSEKLLRRDPKILIIEALAHAERFYATFWSFDDTNYKAKINKAGYLGGKALKEVYKALEEKEYYQEIKRKGYYVTSMVDSIDRKNFSFSDGVIRLTVFGHMSLRNDQMEEVRKLNMQLAMVLVDRKLGTNPNGMSIERITIISNELVKQTKNIAY